MLNYVMRRKDKQYKIARRNRELRDKARVSAVLNGIGLGFSVDEIHRSTGLSTKNIRKIMVEYPEATFAMVKKQ